MDTKGIYAVSIGVSNYSHMHRLTCAANDAMDIAEVLRGGASQARVKLLVDAAATRAAVMSSLAWLAINARSEDTAIVYFSGHSGRQSEHADCKSYFCPVEASSANIERTCISSDELTEALRAIRSGRLVVLLDTCYSGGLGEPRNSGSLNFGLNCRDVEGLVEGYGRVIIAASRPDELAWEVSAMRNGLFTTYLLRGLRGQVAQADGTIWVSEIFSYVSRSVRRHRCQHPYQKAIGEDFVVMVQQNKMHPVRLAALPGDQRQFRIAMRKVYNGDELSLLCSDLGLSVEDLPARTLETQIMHLIDHCYRHGLYEQLIERVRTDRPQLDLCI